MSARVHRSVEQVAGAGPRIPVLSIDSGVAGPVVCIGANLHGDESTGLGVVHALDGVLPRLLARGRVFLYPSLNPLGLEQGSRRMPGDGLDPNRAFPGSARGSRAERHADRLWRDILARRPELYIDLHTDTAGAVPYAIVDRVVRGPRAAALAARCRVLAAASGLT
ncbi:MAG: succinylglutamate desuccinylase/aspartoacylase family protein, partial [Myxococcota bacterium]|nr:succinylglutamate desuccinylase/aspartoacylase family protein [Myxococcota bacterium]MEC8425246.1 succinylglutamate desuccinylase/aspartoacylase family protein [Myxococcota bacterium]